MVLDVDTFLASPTVDPNLFINQHWLKKTTLSDVQGRDLTSSLGSRPTHLDTNHGESGFHLATSEVLRMLCSLDLFVKILPVAVLPPGLFTN